ncbi:MAG: universal stress protein [Gemmatimonas sp.]
MYSTLIVPLDGSAFAEQAITPAVFMSRRSRAVLHLLRVHEGSPDPGYRTPAWDEYFRSEEEAYLEALTARVQDGFAGTVEWELVDGHVVPAICARAESCRAPLVAMSTHGRTGIRRTWLGSVASGVVRHTSAPVLMVRPPSEPDATHRVATESPFANIVIPLDGSAFAEQVLPHAISVAWTSTGRLVLLRVVESREKSSAAIRQASAYLNDVASRMRSECSSVDARVEVHSSPGAAILACAAALERPLVAMASHGRGLSRLFLGSVADEVVRGTAGAVLMIRPCT